MFYFQIKTCVPCIPDINASLINLGPLNSDQELKGDELYDEIKD